MPQHRKPQPKSQKEISDSLVNPYVNPSDGSSFGDPNPNQFNQFTPNEQNGVTTNRSEQLSFKGDTAKPFTLGLQDIDESILYYFSNIIKPHVNQNGQTIPVPVIYGSPERWKSAQADGYYKDKDGQIMLPLIMFKRDSIDKNRAVWQKLDANAPHLYTSWKKPYSAKNAYSNFSALTNRIPDDQFIVNVIPDYVKIKYSCVIQTYYVEQLNKIIEAINYASDSYWGNPERFKFKATIDSFSTISELVDGQDRVVKSTFTINLYGYIVPDNIQKEINSIKKYNSKSQIVIGLEVDGVGGAELVSMNRQTTPTTFPSQISSGASSIGGGVNPATLVYLNTNVQQLGTFVNTTTITFPRGWLVAPSGLPSTTSNNFSLFCNGVLIDNSAITSFSESGGTTTLVINPTILGYNLESIDEVIAIGKFS